MERDDATSSSEESEAMKGKDGVQENQTVLRSNSREKKEMQQSTVTGIN